MGGGSCNREEGKDLRGRWLGEEKCNHGAPCWSGSEKMRQGWGTSARSWGITEEPVTLAENTDRGDKESRGQQESLFHGSQSSLGRALKPTRHQVGPLYRCYRGADLR